MDQLTLHWSPGAEPLNEEDLEAVACVNGVSLVELARAAELAIGVGDRFAGLYRGLPLSVMSGPHRLLLSEVDPAEWVTSWGYRQGERVTVLRCGCGVPGCRSLTARLTLEADLVRWSDFVVVDSDRLAGGLGALGPFVFERAQYEASLTAGPPSAAP